MLIQISTATTYPGLLEQIVTHWTSLNAERVGEGKAALVLPGGSAVGDAEAARLAIALAVAAVTGPEHDRDVAVAERTTARTAARDAMDGWRRAVASKLARTAYAAKLPSAPSVKAGDKDFFDALDEAARRWGLINGASNVPHFTAPLLLPDGTTLAQFVAKVTLARDKTKLVRDSDDATDILRKQRDALLPPAKQLMEDYLLAVRAEYAPGSTWVQTLPKLNPAVAPKPGTVKVKVSFDAAAHGWRLTWKASTLAGAHHYAVRLSVGPRYRPANARSLADLPQNTTTYLIAESEVPGGSVVWGRVFVVPDGGDELASNAVKLTR